MKVKIPNLVFPNQHDGIEKPHGSGDIVIVSDTAKAMFNLDIEWTDKRRSIVKYVSRALVKKKSTNAWKKGNWYNS